MANLDAGGAGVWRGAGVLGTPFRCLARDALGGAGVRGSNGSIIWERLDGWRERGASGVDSETNLTKKIYIKCLGTYLECQKPLWYLL